MGETIVICTIYPTEKYNYITLPRPPYLPHVQTSAGYKVVTLVKLPHLFAQITTRWHGLQAAIDVLSVI